MGEEEVREVIVDREQFQGLVGSSFEAREEGLLGSGGVNLGARMRPSINSSDADMSMASIADLGTPEEEGGYGEEEYRQVSVAPVQGWLKDMAVKFAKKYRLDERFGDLAHRFLGVDPDTGRIIGSLAGNLIFGTGGKDNVLKQLGKVVLDKIVTGKWKRNVKPFVPPTPDGRGPPPPLPSGGGGDGGPDMGPPPEGEGASLFYAIRDRCLQEQQLYEDPDFPATESSLYFSRSAPYGIEWLRPSELVQDPLLFVEGHSRFDVQQGKLGNCWMLAAVASLTLQDELFYRVVPPDQSFTENYAGVFHFQFWQYGQWVDVIVDDRLPTSGGELLYMHSANTNEFWAALLEKAYAKVHGSYEALKGGTTSEALEDFTGGLTELIDLRQNPPTNLLNIMFTSFQRGSLLGAAIQGQPGQVSEGRLPNGLVTQHAYTISGMQMVDYRGRQVPLLRVRNPWGKGEGEWEGAWADGSPEWDSIPPEQKEAMGLNFEHDGEFWIDFRDFMQNFSSVEICNLGPEVMDEIAEMTGERPHAAANWNSNTHHGEWLPGVTAGGCRNYLQTFAMNPQLLMQVDADAGGDCCVIISVMQKYRRQLKADGLDMLPIGFAAYQLDDYTDTALDTNGFEQRVSVAKSPVFINLRDVTARFRLPPGYYVVVPSTYRPDEEGQFMVRLFADGPLRSKGLVV